MTSKTLEDYIKLPYTIEVLRDEGESISGWFAKVVELPGCMTQAESFSELGEMINDAIRSWIETALEEGLQIPEPKPQDSYSGKFVIRVPKSLHRELVEEAERDGVSLNSYISYKLGKSIGQTSDESVKQVQTEEISLISWPKLSKKAQHVLSLNGMEQEGKEVDELLFSSWIEDHIMQIRTAIASGYYRDALQYVEIIKQSIGHICNSSPILKTYCQIISILEDQINENAELREGLIKQSYVRSRTTAQIKSSSELLTKSILFTSDTQDYFEDVTSDEDRLAIEQVRRKLEFR